MNGGQSFAGKGSSTWRNRGAQKEKKKKKKKPLPATERNALCRPVISIADASDRKCEKA